MVAFIKKLFRIHTHEKKVFCVGRIAFVKCTTCGMESIPWTVPQKTADEWHEVNPNAMKDLLAINA